MSTSAGPNSPENFGRGTETVPEVLSGPSGLLTKVFIDSSMIDVILIGDTDRLPIGRVRLEIAFDAYSYMVTGYYVSCTESPDRAMAECLAYSILPKEGSLALHEVKGRWPVHGLPKTIHVDEKASSDLEELKHICTQHGIALECSAITRAPRRHRAGIEQFLRSLDQSIRSFSKTTSFNDQSGKNSAFQEFLGMTKFEFESFLMNFIVNVYHPGAQAALSTSPQSKWDDAASMRTGKPRI